MQWLKKYSEKIGLDINNAFGRVEQDDDLTIRAQAIATRMGVTISKIDVVEPATGKPLINAGAARGGKIVIGRALIKSFSSEEIDFVLAHELAHLKCKHVFKMIAWLPVGTILIGIGAILPMFLGKIPLIGLSFWMTILGGWLLVGNLTWLSRRRELEADRIALSTTRNYPAAISALRKLASNNVIEIPEESEGYLTHPREAHRAQALRRMARKLKLTDVEPGSE